MDRLKICGIYKIISPSGKIYIGQSVNIKDRFRKYRTLNCKQQIKLYNSLVKYGFDDHKCEIIEECNENQLLEREIYWKEYYKVLKIPSLCCRIDGKGGNDSEETRQNKLKKSNKFKKDILELYNAKSILEISKILNLDYGTIKLFLVKEGIYEKGKNFKKHPKSRIDKMKKIMINKLGTKIYQMDINGNIINEFPSQAEAFRKTGIGQSCISSCCRGKQKSAGGFIWKYKEN